MGEPSCGAISLRSLLIDRVVALAILTRLTHSSSHILTKIRYFILPSLCADYILIFLG